MTEYASEQKNHNYCVFNVDQALYVRVPSVLRTLTKIFVISLSWRFQQILETLHLIYRHIEDVHAKLWQLKTTPISILFFF